MEAFAALTGRRYRLFDYVGHPEAERVIVMMGSGAEAAHELCDWLVTRGERVGVLKVRPTRPRDHFLAALPETVRAIAVLDRAKEAGRAWRAALPGRGHSVRRRSRRRRSSSDHRREVRPLEQGARRGHAAGGLRRLPRSRAPHALHHRHRG
ncbi:MAG: hypothetical protein U0166_12095 [Acidobacteriota bacterium]